METENLIPLFPLGIVMLPNMPAPLHIFEERYKIMIGECLAEDKPFGIVYFNGRDIEKIGCTARVVKVIRRYQDGRLDILTVGEQRFIIRDIDESRPYLQAAVTFFDDSEETLGPDTEELARSGMKMIEEMAGIDGTEIELGPTDLKDLKDTSFFISASEGFEAPDKQVFLEMTSTRERLQKSVAALSRIIARLRLSREIQRIIKGNGHLAGETPERPAQ